ncbi:MAG: YvcK family protein [Chloroflexi bacterium]|nr:YvcK family protein [Chloroflexota bacterium]
MTEKRRSVNLVYRYRMHTDLGMNRATPLGKWFTPGIGVKRWLVLLVLGIILEAYAITYGTVPHLYPDPVGGTPLGRLLIAAGILILGAAVILVALIGFARRLLAPYQAMHPTPVIDAVYTHSRRNKGLRVVAVGGGTGLPAVLKGLKAVTGNITAVVTVADDGGSSGRLRRDLGVLPPGDLRNNIAALADDESLMTRLFQYRFNGGELAGHAFGNLFISALSGVTGSLETALVEIERVLNIQGSVYPSTLEDVTLSANIRVGGSARPVTVIGESQITAMNGTIEKVWISPVSAQAFPGSVAALREANLVIIGPGSLYTSILPNLLVNGIVDALRNSDALKIYVCNIATQPGETTDFTVADHILALERHIGRGVIQVVVANNAYPQENAGVNTRYVQPTPADHEVWQRYRVHYTDLVDTERPWRHDPQKLVKAILFLSEAERTVNVAQRRAPAQDAQREAYTAS